MKFVGYILSTIISMILAYMTTLIAGMVLNSPGEFMPLGYKIFMLVLFIVFSVAGIRAVNEMEK